MATLSLSRQHLTSYRNSSILTDFLRQPSSPLAQPAAIAEFGHAVDALRDATDRLEARLRILRESKAQPAGMAGGSLEQNNLEQNNPPQSNPEQKP